MGFRNNGLFSFCVSQSIRRIHTHVSEEKRRQEECWSVVKMILISPLVVVSFFSIYFDVLIKDFATNYWQSTFCKPLIC